MKKPSFVQGAAVGALLAVAGASLFATLRLFVAPADVLEMLIPVVSAAYLVYLLTRSGVPTGRVATLVLWFVSAAAIAFFVDSLALVFVLHALLVWLVRSLYFHDGALAALMDLGLSVLAVAAAVGAAQHSHSPFLAFWTFFLIQALFVAIPESLAVPVPATRQETNAPFRRAQHAADGALRRLLSPR